MALLELLALLAKRRDVLLLSDEVYRAFCYDGAFASPAEFNEDVLVLDGFSKALTARIINTLALILRAFIIKHWTPLGPFIFSLAGTGVSRPL